MTTTSAAPLHRAVGRGAFAAWRELVLCWSFTWGDLTATVVPATTFAGAAWATSGRPLAELPEEALLCVAYFWLYIYTFNLSNQLTGIEEDRLNKPHRPLVVGAVTPRGAWWRLLVVSGAFLGMGAALGVIEWGMLWVAAWLWHNHFGGARVWWGKNAAMVAGTVAQLAAAWQLVTPLTSAAWSWILAIAVPLGLLVSLQDLRDVAGDLAIGRRTAVVVFGERAARTVFGTAFVVYPVLLYLLLYRHAPVAAVVLGGVGAVVCLIISYRVIRLRNSRSDNTTYVLYTLWYCVTLASGIPALAH
ncbi:UbiA family prenyltransferase [Nocardia sp. BMG51109]|uniref:UbiA family prenyltransferase n=1 Tax=Nocardia sp. BMG51109 TaxID=1056816 RepID=UPI000463E844|nr:UbiA family prenyltransferase [Nocardia sp. BMG51109]